MPLLPWGALLGGAFLDSRLMVIDMGGKDSILDLIKSQLGLSLWYASLDPNLKLHQCNIY